MIGEDVRESLQHRAPFATDHVKFPPVISIRFRHLRRLWTIRSLRLIERCVGMRLQNRDGNATHRHPARTLRNRGGIGAIRVT